MRKLLLPIINLVNVILVSIAFGLGAPTSYYAILNGKEDARGNWYQLVWQRASHANIVGIIGFFLFVFAVAVTVAVFIPFKCRKYTNILGAVMYIGAGVLMLLTPKFAAVSVAGETKLSGALIAMAVLVLVAGALSVVMAAIEFTAKEDK